MNEDIQRQLQPWKTKAFREGAICLEDVIASLKGGNSDLIELVPNKAQTVWTVMNKATKAPACIYYAGIWAWGTPMHTGNYVPIGESVSEVPEHRVQVSASLQCEFSYVFETSEDFTLYDHLTALENYVLEHTPFGKLVSSKPRTDWQNPEVSLSNHRYIFSSKVFALKPKAPKSSGQKTPLADKRTNAADPTPPKVPDVVADYKLHPWIKAAVEKKQSRVTPNPNRPRLLAWDDATKTLKRVTETNGHKYSRFDIVWFSFMPFFVVKSKVWAPQLQPVEFVSVDKVQGAMPSHQGMQWEDTSLPSLKPLKVEDSDSDMEEWEAEAMATDTTFGKRKRSRDGGEDMDVDHRPAKAMLKDHNAADTGARDTEMGSSSGGSPTPWSLVEEGVSLMEIDDEDENTKSDRPMTGPPGTTTNIQMKRLTRQGGGRR